MSVEAADLIQPLGHIEPDLFSKNDPAGDTATRVEAWLEEAEGRAEDADDADAAQAAWVYYRAFDSIATRYASQPSQLAPDGSVLRQYISQQIAEFRRLSDYWRGVFNGYVPEESDEGADAGNSQLSTRSVRNAAAW